jgi:uridylate kinase
MVFYQPKRIGDISLLGVIMDRVVVSLGGSVLVPEESDLAYLKALSALMRELAQRYELILVCGGGKVARYYITIGRELGATRDQQDELGIAATRLNANLLRLALGDAAMPEIPKSIQEATMGAMEGKVLVMGGTVPGHTTDAVAAMVAEAVGAVRVVNATSVDAAYTADPKRHNDAKRLEEITHQQLYDLVNKGLHSAGPSDVFDRLGAEIAMRARIPVFIVYGRDLVDLEAAIKGEKVKGTVVRN